MANQFRISRRAASEAADAVTRLLTGGRLRLYGEAPQPATVDAAVPGRAILLVELTLGRPAFLPAIDGSAEAREIEVVRAIGRGTAQWFRALTPNGQAVYDGAIGEQGSGAELEIGSTIIAPGMEVVITSMIYTQPKD